MSASWKASFTNPSCVTGWLYVESASEFRRLLHDGGRHVTSGDVTDVTVQALPATLELTVGVRDGGTPPRSTLGRLLVVAAASPDGEPVVVSSTSSFGGLTWIQRLIIVVGSTLGAALLATVVFTVLVSPPTLSVPLSWHSTAPTRTPTRQTRLQSYVRHMLFPRVRRVGVGVRVGVVECQLYKLGIGLTRKLS